jgi:hypothetical protein
MMIFKITETKQKWLDGIACANMVLIFWAMIHHFKLVHWSHAIALTELALRQKQELKQNFERASSTLNITR